MTRKQNVGGFTPTWFYCLCQIMIRSHGCLNWCSFEVDCDLRFMDGWLAAYGAYGCAAIRRLMVLRSTYSLKPGFSKHEKRIILSREWKNWYNSSFHSSYWYRPHIMHFHLFSFLKRPHCPLNVEKIAIFKSWLYTDPDIEREPLGIRSL